MKLHVPSSSQDSSTTQGSFFTGPRMRLSIITSIALFCSLMFASDSLISPRFRTVYILEMSNALDQHLASRLSSTRLLWVVLDPGSADAVLTDSIDAAFWTWMQRTYPPAGAGSGSERTGAATSAPDVPPGVSQRGTIFLVDPRKRLVIWSTYELPRNSTPPEMDRSANRIVNQLKAAFGKK
jgi:hypothetical protein